MDFAQQASSWRNFRFDSVKLGHERRRFVRVSTYDLACYINSDQIMAEGRSGGGGGLRILK
jgi:hypothetical protein